MNILKTLVQEKTNENHDLKKKLTVLEIKYLTDVQPSDSLKSENVNLKAQIEKSKSKIQGLKEKIINLKDLVQPKQDGLFQLESKNEKLQYINQKLEKDLNKA